MSDKIAGKNKDFDEGCDRRIGHYLKKAKAMSAEQILIVDYQFREHEDGLSQQKLKRAVEYIQAHSDENLSLTAIADELGMSQYYFCRLFKRSTGVSPHQYLIQQRIERAKQLLKQPGLTVTAVALECGFTNQSHFAKHFRQRTGITPKQFRKL